MQTETQVEKLKRRLREEPYVPIGCALTAGILVAGIVTFKRGNKQLSQTLMRARVAAQFGTMGAIGGGAYFAAVKKSQDNKISPPAETAKAEK